VDDPALTCRLRAGRDPLRVVVDGRARTPPRARVLRLRSPAPTLVAVAADASPARRRLLARAGAQVLVLPGRDGRFALRALLRALGKRGALSVLVEGGGDLAAALLRARLVDRLVLITAPRLIGGDGVPAVGPLGLRSLAAGPVLRDVRTWRLGPDLVRDGTVHYRGRAAI
jgi:diaminohydroxyphosphoribosylaminopyrimidine deaminase/5-amino-6-(5-phosphoribosylamino)uracil reductase